MDIKTELEKVLHIFENEKKQFTIECIVITPESGNIRVWANDENDNISFKWDCNKQNYTV